jgi:hypothetical protein
VCCSIFYVCLIFVLVLRNTPYKKYAHHDARLFPARTYEGRQFRSQFHGLTAHRSEVCYENLVPDLRLFSLLQSGTYNVCFKSQSIDVRGAQHVGALL